MKKMIRRIIVCCLIATSCWTYFLMADRQKLQDELIRFHVVAHSDSEKDQSVKYLIRDAVLESIQTDLQKISDVQEAKNYLHDNLPNIQKLVNKTLDDLGIQEDARVSLGKEPFEIRHYDTFTLPAGVYESLRIVIGEGNGKNWWCVSFPSLCIPATTSGFSDVATSAGLSVSLVQTLSGNEDYSIRFFFLNQLGKLENIFFKV